MLYVFTDVIDCFRQKWNRFLFKTQQPIITLIPVLLG